LPIKVTATACATDRPKVMINVPLTAICRGLGHRVLPLALGCDARCPDHGDRLGLGGPEMRRVTTEPFGMKVKFCPRRDLRHSHLEAPSLSWP